jgi:hypothetical protein
MSHRACHRACQCKHVPIACVNRENVKMHTLARSPRHGRRDEAHEIGKKEFQADTIEIVTIKHYRQRLTDKPGDL